MADLENKENMSPVRLRKSSSPGKSLSPPKPTKKARSRSIGPEELEASRRKSPDQSRRRSAMTQVIQLPPKGILPSKSEEQKRKEARRKSLANRRVSFAPEATLHTWDVIEYMRDATTSSASSSAGRPSFAGTPARHAWEQESDPPSTPPEQADDHDDLPASPEHQRDVHQKKRRRSSVIPPMNFNNPEDDFSSSPASGSSVVEGSSDVDEEDEEDYDSDDDGESTAMSLDTGDNTAHSEETESTDSSLTARLRQASEMAGTRGIDYDEHGEDYDDQDEDVEENGDMSMEMVTQEVTHAFKPWAQQSYGPPPMAKNIIALQDQENINPFSPAFRQAYPHRKPQGVPSTVGEDTEPDSEDMSMDITRAVGGILPAPQLVPQDDEDDENDMSMDMTRAVGGILLPQQRHQQQQQQQVEDRSHMDDENEHEDDNDASMDMTRAVGGILPSHQTIDQSQTSGDETMDFTQAVGAILPSEPDHVQTPRSSLKRRHSTTEGGSPQTNNVSPVNPPQRRTVAQVSAKRRRSSTQRASIGDATMDFTMAVGGIQQQPSPAKESRRSSLRRRRSSGMSSVADDRTMELTTAVGSIRQPALGTIQEPTELESMENDEELSMELTAVISGAHRTDAVEEVSRPATPRECSSPIRTEIPTTPSREGHFREAEDQSAKKLLTPVFAKHINDSAVKDSAGSRRSSARKSTASPVKNTARHTKSPSSAQRNSPALSRSPLPTKLTPVSARKSPASTHRAASLTPRARPTPGRDHTDSDATPAVAKESEHDDASASVANDDITASFSPVRDEEMQANTDQEIVYPKLPVPEDGPSSSDAGNGPSIFVSQTHVPHTVSEAGSPLPTSAESPEQIDMEIALPASPLQDKQLRSSPMKKPTTPQQQPSSPVRKSVTPQQRRSSPVRKSVTPQQMQGSAIRSMTPQQAQSSPLFQSTTRQNSTSQSPQKLEALVTTPQQLHANDDPSKAISNSIKMMSTPRKDTGTTPLKRLRGMTPMKSPAKRTTTPRQAFTPKVKAPQSGQKSREVELAGQKLAQELFAVTKAGKEVPRVKLNEFLDMAGIKFMELALPTKRRFTIAPTLGKAAGNDNGDNDDNVENVDLENAVVAGACTIPMLDLFQHSCRELKRYIAEGKAFVKTLESEVHADTPPLISAYVTADASRKLELDGHMRDIKTNARLGSKEIWYEWRSKLLDGLQDGLSGIRSSLEQDARVLGEREQLLETLLPDLLTKHEALQNEAVKLEEAAAATSEEEKEELNATRETLVDVNAQIEERKRMLASFQQEMQEQESLIEAYGEGKAECLAQIREAERVKDSCRGWTVDEVAALKASVSALESSTGWTITSASSSTLTMTYRTSIALYFDTAAFLPLGNRASAPHKTENQPISLTYIGGKADRPETLPTESRFFLQLMRAQLQCLEQRSTSIKTLLRFVSSGWDIANNVTEAIRRLRVEHPVSVAILSDERLGVDVDVLLPKVQTKVRLNFELSAAIVTENQADGGFQVGTHLAVTGKVVYGETYNEKSMDGFLGRRCGGFGEGWEDAVRELRVRLVATGRKG